MRQGLMMLITGLILGLYIGYLAGARANRYLYIDMPGKERISAPIEAGYSPIVSVSGNNKFDVRMERKERIK